MLCALKHWHLSSFAWSHLGHVSQFSVVIQCAGVKAQVWLLPPSPDGNRLCLLLKKMIFEMTALLSLNAYKGRLNLWVCTGVGRLERGRCCAGGAVKRVSPNILNVYILNFTAAPVPTFPKESSSTTTRTVINSKQAVKMDPRICHSTWLW